MFHYSPPRITHKCIKSISHNVSVNFWIALLKNLLLVTYALCTCHHRYILSEYVIAASLVDQDLKQVYWLHTDISSSVGDRTSERWPAEEEREKCEEVGLRKGNSCMPVNRQGPGAVQAGNKLAFAILGKGCDPGGELLKLHKKVIM